MGAKGDLNLIRSEPRLLPRIRKLWENGQALDAEDVANELRCLFPEYNRKKYTEFLKLVEVIVEKLEGEKEVSIVDLTVSENGDSVTRPEVKKRIPDRKRQGSLLGNDNQKKPRTVQRVGLPLTEFGAEKSSFKFSHVGGCERQLLDVCRFCMHLLHPEIHESLGVTPPTGFLLHGPPGCGKTLFAQAVAGEFDLPLIKLASTELVSGVSGETEEKIRRLFAKAIEQSPCVLLFDEIDAIAPKRETASREMEKRIVSQIITCLDDLSTCKTDPEVNVATDGDDLSVSISKKDKQKLVLVIGTTNRPESLDPALRRAGRFDKEIPLGIPDKKARLKILQIVCEGMKLDQDVSLQQLSGLTPGYVGADLKALVREAAMCAVNRIYETVVQKTDDEKSAEVEQELQRMLLLVKSEETIDSTKLLNMCISSEDFLTALSLVHPSAKREGFATVPDVKWDDIGALKDAREELKWSILYPIRRPEVFEALQISCKPQGILLCGPPGCGKTLLAKAVANESGMNFISVKGPELLSMYVGESERAVRTVFQRARNSSPCVIFFDEIDSLCPKRTSSENSGSARLVNQLLTEMDGMESRREVFLIGATNRPDIVDPAILRPGRLDKILFVGMPNADDREDILRKLTSNKTKPLINEDVSLQEIAADPLLKHYTGADLVALVHEAGVAALKERMLGNTGVDCLSKRHFIEAARHITPSVSENERIIYKKLYETYGVKKT